MIFSDKQPIYLPITMLKMKAKFPYTCLISLYELSLLIHKKQVQSALTRIYVLILVITMISSSF